MKISSTIIETNLGKIYIETINKSVVKLEWTNIKKIPKIETANTLLKNVKKQDNYIKAPLFEYTDILQGLMK